MKILICGKSGSGKSTFAEKLAEEVSKNLGVEWLNGDDIREQADDWDFTADGRRRQCLRIKRIADEAKLKGIVTVSDFICPTKTLRELFDPDIIIYMEHESTGEYPDSDSLFEEPSKDEYDFKLTINDDLGKWAGTIADLIWILE